MLKHVTIFYMLKNIEERLSMVCRDREDFLKKDPTWNFRDEKYNDCDEKIPWKKWMLF